MLYMGVPNKIIQERMKQKSLDALHTDEKMNNRQHKTVSNLLSNPSVNVDSQLTILLK